MTNHSLSYKYTILNKAKIHRSVYWILNAKTNNKCKVTVIKSNDKMQIMKSVSKTMIYNMCRVLNNTMEIKIDKLTSKNKRQSI